MVAHKHIQAFLVLALAGPLTVLSCGPGDSDTDSDDTDTSDETDTTEVTDETDTTDDSSDETNDTTVEPGVPNSCDGPGDTYEPVELNAMCTTTAPPNCLINEFGDTFTCGSDECWGDDTSLTGGAFTYTEGDGSIAYTKDAEGFLSLTGEAYTYSGFGMWFGPCTDASSWDGLEIQITGDLGGVEVAVQLQTDENYPAEDDKGSCMFESEDSKWTDCSNAQTIVEGITTDGLTPIHLTWDDFTGGKPNDAVDPRQLRGVQLQFNCDEETAETVPCAFDIQLRDLRWFKAAE